MLFEDDDAEGAKHFAFRVADDTVGWPGLPLDAVVGAERLQFEPSLDAEINELAAIAETSEVLERQNDDGAAIRELESDYPMCVSFIARPSREAHSAKHHADGLVPFSQLGAKGANLWGTDFACLIFTFGEQGDSVEEPAHLRLVTKDQVNLTTVV